MFLYTIDGYGENVVAYLKTSTEIIRGEFDRKTDSLTLWEPDFRCQEAI